MADARGEYWYLEEGVDPNKITVPELRSILLKHGVRYQASAKKPALLDLFRANVLPHAGKLKRAAARTVRSARGIEDVSSSAASTTTDDVEDEFNAATGYAEEEPALPPQTPRRTTRRTTRATTAEMDERRAKTPAHTVPTKHARESDADADVDADTQYSVRRMRKSAPQVVAKEPTPDPESWTTRGVNSPFTQENPFQSGSSPAYAGSAVRDRRRKTTGYEFKEKRKSDAHRRKTFQPNSQQADSGVVVPTRETFEMSVPHAADNETASQSDSDLGEEFTPEEELALVRERAKNGEVDILPPRRNKRPSTQRSQATGALQSFLLTAFSAAVFALGVFLRNEKAAVGFCGIGQDPTISINDVAIPEALTVFMPQCEPCPPHAICYPNLEVVCDRDFIKKDHPLSFGGLIPLPPTCEPDTEKTRKVTHVADRAVQILRKRRAQYECGDLDSEGNKVESPDVSVAELEKSIIQSKRKGVSNEEFEDLFARAIGETKLREEVVVGKKEDGTTDESRLSSSSLAELSLACSIRRSFRETVERHILSIVGILFALFSGWYGNRSIKSYWATEALAKQLASDVFDRLANQAALAQMDSGAYKDRGLSAYQLRDDVLRNEFSSSRRIKLWKKVQNKVEFNTNIRASVREGHGGDVTRMWEWVGPVQLLEDGHGSGKRDGRYSQGWTPESKPAVKEGKEVKKWDEGRPIY